MKGPLYAETTVHSRAAALYQRINGQGERSEVVLSGVSSKWFQTGRPAEDHVAFAGFDAGLAEGCSLVVEDTTYNSQVSPASLLLSSG